MNLFSHSHLPEQKSTHNCTLFCKLYYLQLRETKKMIRASDKIKRRSSRAGKRGASYVAPPGSLQRELFDALGAALFDGDADE